MNGGGRGREEQIDSDREERAKASAWRPQRLLRPPDRRKACRHTIATGKNTHTMSSRISFSLALTFLMMVRSPLCSFVCVCGGVASVHDEHEEITEGITVARCT